MEKNPDAYDYKKAQVSWKKKEIEWEDIIDLC
jgi:hypothetical protein